MSDPAWLVEARKDLGVHEKVGPGSNPRVLAIFRDAGHPEVTDDGVAWCAAGIGAWLHRAGIQGTGKLNARSYETWGIALPGPVYGCIAVKRRAGKNAPAWQGHTGIVVAANATTVWLLGANQADSVSISPFHRDEFTAYRWPPGVPLPAGPLPTSATGVAGVTEA